MQRVSLGDYLASPIGKWTSGDRWVHFCASDPYLSGTLFWGHVDEAVAEATLRCAAAAMRAIPVPHAALIDGSRGTTFDPGVFGPVSRYVAEHRVALSASVTKLAGIRPLTVIGALAEGFFRVVPAPYPVGVYGDRTEGLAWLGCSDHAQTVAEIEALAGAVVASSRILGDLHRCLEGALLAPDPVVIAKDLGMSIRSLQRKLHAEGTTFQREVTIVRVRAAQRRMIETDLSLAEIAIAVGFSSAAGFSVAFRKVASTTPKDWRDSHRR